MTDRVELLRVALPANPEKLARLLDSVATIWPSESQAYAASRRSKVTTVRAEDGALVIVREEVWR